ncbi:MAG: hypothetical protein AAFQ36_11475 [Pseudomonadota bacterium]
MSDEDPDELADMLNDGWDLAGYSVNMLAAGALAHNVLLRKGNDLTSVVILKQGDSETGRVVSVLSPRPEKKKGFWG